MASATSLPLFAQESRCTINPHDSSCALQSTLHLLHWYDPDNHSVPYSGHMLGYASQFGVLALLSMTGVALGLLLSACVATPDRANALLPYVLIPQMILGGGFTGLIAAKFIPTLLPASLTGSIGSSTGGRFILTLAAALASGWAATKFVNPQFGDGVLFGGLIQAGSVALNTFLPSVYTSLGVGLGELMPGRFPVPQNPIRAAMASRQIAAPVGAQARVTMSGLTRAYGTAF